MFISIFLCRFIMYFNYNFPSHIYDYDTFFVLSISVTFTTLLHSPNNINYTLPVVASHYGKQFHSIQALSIQMQLQDREQMSLS